MNHDQGLVNSLFETDIDVFLENAEKRGIVDEAELEALTLERELDDGELAAVRAELAVREVEIVPAVELEGDETRESSTGIAHDATTTGTTDSLTLFMNELGRYELLTAAPGNTGLYVGQPGDPRTVGVSLRMRVGTR